MTSKQWLHLFTSNLRPLYVQDAVEVLGAVAGDRRTFRYAGRYIPNEIQATWASNGLTDVPVVVHFALQHPASLHEPVYVTLRAGTVVSTQREGDTFTVTFALGKHLPFPQDEGQVGLDSQAIRSRAQLVQRHTRALSELLTQRTPNSRLHAVLGPDPRGTKTLADPTSDDARSGQAFETLVTFVSPAVFAPSYFYMRIAGLLDENGNEVNARSDGLRKLPAGKQATLRIHHFQLEPPPAETRILVTVPDTMQLLGPKEIFVGSRYDVIDIKVFMPHRDVPMAGEVVLTSSGSHPGPVLRVPVLVEPSIVDGAITPVLGLGAAVFAAMPAIFDSWSTGSKLLAASVGILLGGYVALHRRGRGLTA